MDIQSLKRSLVSVFKNIPGKSVGRKIIVIEADDWGSIRMPSKEVHAKLLEAGLPNNGRYDRNDTLEDSDDLEALFSVLRKYKDKRGRSAVITPFCNMANPDFEKIKNSGFSEYHYEKFSTTYLRYQRRSDILTIWNQGVSENIFIPEYHGREHIATDLWLKALKTDDKKLKIAFENGFVSYSPAWVPSPAKDFRPNFYIEHEQSLPSLKHSLEDGVDIFKQTFNFSPVVFNAPNGVFVQDLNSSLINKGLKFNAVPRKRLDRSRNGIYEYVTYKTAQKSAEGITYYVRNCNFEPSEKSYKGVGHVLSQISGAFICGKAAIIGTHRVNFAGGLNEANRLHGLTELEALLKGILKKWPDVEFMSSTEFCALL